jgi:hypothetical protein
MKNKFLQLIKYLQRKIKKIWNYVYPPGSFISKIILWLYGNDIYNVPYPFLNFVLNHIGRWPGVSIFISSSEYTYRQKINKIKQNLKYLLVSLLFLFTLFVLFFTKQESFLFGFAQNLLADLILILLVLYLLPNILNEPKKYNVSLRRKPNYENYSAQDRKKEVSIYIKNDGEETYKEGELSWELLIPDKYCSEADITSINGNIESHYTLAKNMWLISGINDTSFFVDQNIEIATITIDKDRIKQNYDSPLKIYYQLKTIDGNIPTVENITRDFIGYAIPFDDYPKLGDFILYEWYESNK